MNSIFFFYTLTLLIICILAAAVSLSAYLSSRQRKYALTCATFVLYTIGTTEIFFNEYIAQNRPFDMGTYYTINMPLVNGAVAVALAGSIWAVVLDVLDKHSKRLLFIPIGALAVGCVLTILLIPAGPLQQWSYYTLRQVFSYFVFGYALYSYYRTHDKHYRLRLARFKRPLRITLALVTLILIEDTLNILILPANAHPTWLPLYLSERNFSENALMIFFAYLLVRSAFNVLSIRLKEAPVESEVDDLERHVNEQMPQFRESHKLSAREAEVLKLVMLGRTNQEIADELFLALGTVKTHVHNILKKCGQKSREALITYFWQH